MKVYPIFTVESPKQAGGSERAKEIIINTVMNVGGINRAEFNAQCLLDVVNGQVCLLVKDEPLMKRVRSWKHNINNILWGHRKNRQLSGFMFHSASSPRYIN